MTLKVYKYACAKPHLHKISNLTKNIVSTGQFTFNYKVLKRYMIRKMVKQRIIWFSNTQIRYFKDLCEPCLNAPESSPGMHLLTRNGVCLTRNAPPHQEWGCASPRMHILTGNGDVPHRKWECD